MMYNRHSIFMRPHVYIFIALSTSLMLSFTAHAEESLKSDNVLPTASVSLPADTKTDVKDDIYLNFDNADLTNFINYIGELKKLNIILDKTLQGVKISLTIREPLSVDGAWNIFLTVLEMSGFSIIETGNVYKVIPKDRKLSQALPAYINVPAETLPDSDLEIRYVIFLQNIQVGDVRDLLVSMLSQPHSVIEQRDVNGFIITDKSYNIKAAAKLLQELDQVGLQETVTVLKLKNVNAVDAKSLLEAIIKKPDGGILTRLLGKSAEGSTDYFPQGTRIIAEERTNVLILLGTTAAIEKIVDFIQTHIDTELKGTESPLHIYELKHTDAQQIAAILKDVCAPPSDFVPGQQAAKYGAIRGGVKYFRSMTFAVDKDGNRLIVSSTDKQDWKLLKKTIKDLDKPQPQVAIETLIVTVAVDDTKELAGALRNKFHGQIGNHIDFQSSTLGAGPSTTNEPSILGNMLSQIVAQQGSTILSFGKSPNIWSIFTALKKEQNASILSQPFMVVTNKTKAELEFGEDRRVVDEESGSDKGYTKASATSKLNIVPQINLDGLIRLDLDISIDDFTDTSGNNIERKNLSTNVTVANGQVLVLGGFVKTKVTEAKNKTPLLGDIPLLGWLFKRQSRTLTKKYLFIFMSPTIIKPRTTPGMQLYTKMKLHSATNEIEQSVQTKKTLDPIHNWFFNPEHENYSHKVIDFANARYQPTTVDISNDPYYGNIDKDKEPRSSTTETQQLNRAQIDQQPTMLALNDNPQNTFEQPLPSQPTNNLTAAALVQTLPPVPPVAPPSDHVAPLNITPPAGAPSNLTSQNIRPAAPSQYPESSQQPSLPKSEPQKTSLEHKRRVLKSLIARPDKAESSSSSSNQHKNNRAIKRENLKKLISVHNTQPSTGKGVA